MKKFFSTLLAAAAISFGASAQYIINFDDYQASPSTDEPISELSEITVTFPNIYELEINTQDAIIVYDAAFNEIDHTSSVDGKVLTVTLDTPITISGSAYLMIGAESLCGWATGYSDFLDNPDDIIIEWTIEGEGGDDVIFNFDATVTPEEGTVASLKDICVTFPNIHDIDISSKDDITFTYNGNDISGVTYRNTDNDENSIYVTLPQEMTAGGEYVLTFPALTLTGYNYDSADFTKDNTEEISFTWTVEGSAEDLNVLASPSTGTTLAELDKVTLNFGSATSCTINLADVVVTKGQDTLTANTDYKVEYAESGNEAYLMFTPALTVTDDTTVGVTFPAGSLSSKTDDAAEVSNKTDLELRYTLVAPVAYDLTLSLNAATKPDADGNINVSEKQITSFFFIADAAGLEPVNTTDKNVVAESEESGINYKAEAKLGKGYGFDSSKSYFSADFGTEPTYNGKYVVTIAQGSFGDAAWIENHAIGHTNPEIELHFNIIGGLTSGVEVLEVVKTIDANAAVYTLQGVKMQGEFNQLPAGIYVVNGRKVVKK